jgi:hypothetical protein
MTGHGMCGTAVLCSSYRNTAITTREQGMNRRSRHAEFTWPVAGADLDALVVLEAVPDAEGRTQWVPRDARLSGHAAAGGHGPTWDEPPAAPRVALPASPLPSSIRIALAVTLADAGAPLPAASVTNRNRISTRFRPFMARRVTAPSPRHRIALTTALERVSLIAMGVVVGAALVIVAVPDVRRATLAANPGPMDVASDTTAAPSIATAGVMPPATLRAAPAVTRVSHVTRPEPPPPAIPAGPPAGGRAPARAVPPPARGLPSTKVAPVAVQASSPAAAPVDTVTPGVIDAIRRYEAAYSRLDAAATQAVWRGADRLQLVQAFSGLREQRLTLRGCVVQPVGDEARATCRGTLRYRPRVGEHSTRTREGRWEFVAGRWADGWVIHSITAP